MAEGLGDLDALRTILAARRTPRHRSTVEKHCKPVDSFDGTPMYDLSDCIAILDGVPTRKRHRRPNRKKLRH